MAERWTPQQTKGLLDGVGSFGWTVLQKRAGHSVPTDAEYRSRDAVRAKMRREFSGGITRGSYSLEQVCEETGYHRTQLKRAMKALGQRWTRTGRGGTFLISAEQVEEMVAWLAHDFWSIQHGLYCCLRCGTESKPHRCMGLCGRCYRKLRRYAKKLGLLFTTRGLLEVATRARAVVGAEHFLDRLVASLEKGHAPSKQELKELAEMRSEVEEGGNESGDDCGKGGLGPCADDCEERRDAVPGVHGEEATVYDGSSD